MVVLGYWYMQILSNSCTLCECIIKLESTTPIHVRVCDYHFRMCIYQQPSLSFEVMLGGLTFQFPIFNVFRVSIMHKLFLFFYSVLYGVNICGLLYAVFFAKYAVFFAKQSVVGLETCTQKSTLTIRTVRKLRLETCTQKSTPWLTVGAVQKLHWSENQYMIF